MTRTAYIGLGANVGDHRDTLNRALRMLDETPGVRVVRTSRFILTEPIGPPQGRYLNGAAVVETSLAAEALLDRLQQIEAVLGRDRTKEVRWGPRTCDLDIEMIDAMVIDSERLTVPHPRMHEREFVLRPMAEIAPNLVHPLLGKTMRELLDAVEAK